MGALFQTILVQPILNLLIWLYNVLPGNDIGLAIISLTIIVKLILWPLTLQQIKQQKALQELQPKIDEIRKRLKDDKDAQAKELLELYKKIVDPSFSYTALSLEELKTKTKASRSNCVLDTTKRESQGYHMTDIHEVLEPLLKEYKTHL
jgi:hypothetical protein